MDFFVAVVLFARKIVGINAPWVERIWWRVLLTAPVVFVSLFAVAIGYAMDLLYAKILAEGENGSNNQRMIAIKQG